MYVIYRIILLQDFNQNKELSASGRNGDDGMSDLISKIGKLEGHVEHINTNIAELKVDLRHSMNELKSDIRVLENELKGDTRLLDNELKGDIRSLEGSMQSNFHWLVGLLVTGFLVTIISGIVAIICK